MSADHVKKSLKKNHNLTNINFSNWNEKLNRYSKNINKS